MKRADNLKNFLVTGFRYQVSAKMLSSILFLEALPGSQNKKINIALIWQVEMDGFDT